MITPQTLNLRVDRTKAVRITFRIKGLDLTSATFRSSVRLYPDAPDAPKIDLPKVTDTSNGMKFMGVETLDGLPISTLQMQIAPATMASSAVPPAEAGKDHVLMAWDLDITPVGGVEAVYVRGAFRVDGVITYG